MPITKQEAEQKVILGNELKGGINGVKPGAPVIYRDAQESEYAFTLSASQLSRHILLLGGAGSGKTNVFNLTVNQLREYDNPDDIYIVFDTKGDFYNNFGKPGDYVIGNSKQYRSVSQRWNIFDEVLSDGHDRREYEINAKEIASVLFEDRGSTSQPFFSNAAKDIFAKTISYFIRRSEEDSRWKSLLNNYNLVNWLNNASGPDFAKIFNFYKDMRGTLSYIGDGKSSQALGVFGELRSMLSDCFIGVFAENDSMGRFSIRNAVKQKGGRAVFIEYDLMTGETLTPIYRLLVDLALKEALGRSENQKNGNVFIILDELKLLPKLQHLDDALNFGRSLGVKVMAGIQTINQLYDIYGEEKGHVLAGGFSTLFAFHTLDSASRDYVSEIFGKNVVSYQYTRNDGSVEVREREGNTVESWDQMDLKTGEAIIGLADETEPFQFVFEEYKRG